MIKTVAVLISTNNSTITCDITFIQQFNTLEIALPVTLFILLLQLKWFPKKKSINGCLQATQAGV